MISYNQMLFDLKDRVITPFGPGVVASRRMKGPDYIEPECYYVVLDSKKHDVWYHGTAFPAEQVKAESKQN